MKPGPEGKLVWRMATPCADCPFNKTGPGRHLRNSLAPGRWREILAGLKSDQHFICHKTGPKTGDGSNLVCAGSIAWSDEHGVSQNMVRVMERIAPLGGR